MGAGASRSMRTAGAGLEVPGRSIMGQVLMRAFNKRPNVMRRGERPTYCILRGNLTCEQRRYRTDPMLAHVAHDLRLTHCHKGSNTRKHLTESL